MINDEKYQRWLSRIEKSTTWKLPVYGRCHRVLNRCLREEVTNYIDLHGRGFSGRDVQTLLCLGLLDRYPQQRFYRYYATPLGVEAYRDLENFKFSIEFCNNCKRRDISCLVTSICNYRRFFVEVSVSPNREWIEYFRRRKW